MIGQLEGQVKHKSGRYVILDVGGVGYKIFVSPDTLTAISNRESTVNFWTHLAVRENALDLYGFLNKNELDFFELLISVSGVGPKSALAILSIAAPDTLTRAISAGDSSYLTKVSGIGKKSAEKIIIELRDKIATLDPGEGLKETGEAIEALQALGYNLRDAREALKKVDPAIADAGEIIKAALKNLGNHKS